MNNLKYFTRTIIPDLVMHLFRHFRVTNKVEEAWDFPFKSEFNSFTCSQCIKGFSVSREITRIRWPTNSRNTRQIQMLNLLNIPLYTPTFTFHLFLEHLKLNLTEEEEKMLKPCSWEAHKNYWRLSRIFGVRIEYVSWDQLHVTSAKQTQRRHYSR